MPFPVGHWYLLVSSPGHIYHSSCPGVLTCIQMNTQILLLEVQKPARVARRRILSEVVQNCSGGSGGRFCFNEAKTFPSDPVTLKSLYDQKSNNGTSRSCLFHLDLGSSRDFTDLSSIAFQSCPAWLCSDLHVCVSPNEPHLWRQS